MRKCLLILLFLLFGCSKEITFTQVSMQEGLNMMQQDQNYILLDVRRIDEYEQFHIPNAINIPNEMIDETIIQQLPDKKQTIYVYCRSGNRSKQASQKLVDLGYEHVIEIGGIIDYPYE